MNADREPPVPAPASAQDPSDRRLWRLLILLISLGFLVGIGVLVLAIRLDWT